MEYYDACRVNENFKKFIPMMDKAIDDFEKKSYEMNGVELTCSLIATDEELDNLRREIKETGLFTVVSSAKNNIEIVSGRVNKGKSVLALASSLGIGQSETIGVGDSINDLALIKAVGLGIAMDNAVAELKAVADTIGCRNTEHIAKYILEKYFAQ
jgi:HAD superfamily hydrolase (TIGR01484 family)